MGKTIKKFFRSYQGRNFLSRWARKIFESSRTRQVLGFNLAAAVFVVSIFGPQAQGLVDKQKINNLSSQDFPAIETKTETTLSWPVKNPQISQSYHFGHWGLDIVDQEFKEVYPVDRGVVLVVTYSRFAYGNHLIIEHPNGRKSLYGHLKEIAVSSGDEVTREMVLGEMGNSGWASGVHLHLEIYQDDKRINPLLILPQPSLE